ncbi:MAG: hypothetical protein IKE24_07385 [Clostridia bacterium]|nr:hypothetical protein [Clostridia bacterium]
MWVQQLIVPQDRQNIGQVLKENGLGVYDEFQLLMLTMGRCAQEDFCRHPFRSHHNGRVPDRHENGISAAI